MRNMCHIGTYWRKRGIAGVEDYRVRALWKLACDPRHLKETLGVDDAEAVTFIKRAVALCDIISSARASVKATKGDNLPRGAHWQTCELGEAGCRSGTCNVSPLSSGGHDHGHSQCAV